MGKIRVRNNNAASDAEVRNTVFKFNKDFGQHILKNPLVAQGIVDKVGKIAIIFQRGLFSNIRQIG